MIWSARLIMAIMLISSQAHALQAGGGGGGAGFACEGTTCICNGTYPDCKKMEGSCKDKITCTGSYCSCTKKTAARQSPAIKPLAPKGNVERY